MYPFLYRVCNQDRLCDQCLGHDDHDTIYIVLMLRYDACFPADSASVSHMIYSLDPELLVYCDKHQVTLISYSHEPTKARWSSFGWIVTAVKKEKVT